MSSANIKLGFRENQTAFQPGEEISGAVHWELEFPPLEVEVRLCWFTRGKGTEDTEIAATVSFDALKAGDVRTFSFEAPAMPYSFSGKLISLIWCVEVVLQPGNLFQREEITIAPNGQEVVIVNTGAPEGVLSR